MFASEAKVSQVKATHENFLILYTLLNSAWDTDVLWLWDVPVVYWTETLCDVVSEIPADVNKRVTVEVDSRTLATNFGVDTRDHGFHILQGPVLDFEEGSLGHAIFRWLMGQFLFFNKASDLAEDVFFESITNSMKMVVHPSGTPSESVPPKPR